MQSIGASKQPSRQALVFSRPVHRLRSVAGREAVVLEGRFDCGLKAVDRGSRAV
jgi:hypothetical protein